MSNVVVTHIIRFIAFVLIQVLLLKNLSPGGESFNYIHLIIYPLFLILLPLRTPHTVLVFLGFLIGLSVDNHAIHDVVGSVARMEWFSHSTPPPPP